MPPAFVADAGVFHGGAPRGALEADFRDFGRVLSVSFGIESVALGEDPPCRSPRLPWARSMAPFAGQEHVADFVPAVSHLLNWCTTPMRSRCSSRSPEGLPSRKLSRPGAATHASAAYPNPHARGRNR